MATIHIRVSEEAAAALRRLAKAEARTLVAVVDRLAGVSGRGSDAGTDNHGEGSRRRVGVADVALCGCGHPAVSHRPKCLVRGCRCLAYKE